MKRAGALFLFAGACLLTLLVLLYAPPSGVSGEQKKMLALLSAYAQDPALDAPGKTAPCSVNGALPDHACTPGAVFAEATPDVICVVGYTKTVRNVSLKLKQQIYDAYGIVYPQPTGSYELDHLVPLELGGNNDAANLFPEAAATASGGAPQNAAGFKEKDLVENYLHQEVCAGLMPLPQAQKIIAEDWLAVYDALSSATISALKAQYRSWAN